MKIRDALLRGFVALLATGACVCVTSAQAADGDWSTAKWGAKGNVEFQVSLGESGPVIGLAHHSWTHGDGGYQLRLALETTGATAVLYKLDYVQQSQGTVGESGLQPRRFEVLQSGRKPETAEFDWQQSRLSIRRDGRERRFTALKTGDQDILSIWHQIGHLDKLPKNVLVAANKNFRRVGVARLEDGSVDVPAGHFATRHFRITSEDGRFITDLWLALDYGMAPVRAVLVDPKVVTLGLQATSVSVSK
ncbi:MAG: DUF3108 domain-containing protein [Azoarcus sp.]|nr:DUF3108 domain-containing protein [Azoarcus sp.]